MLNEPTLECFARENKRLTRLLREAKLKIGQACIEDIDYAARRELDKSVVRQLGTCRWVQEHQNVLITFGRNRWGSHAPGTVRKRPRAP